MDYSSELINTLTDKVLESIQQKPQDIEKVCWLVVHDYKHGFKPSEYDIREIDEELYLCVLSSSKLRIAR